jgi:tight adherence protein B
VFTIGLRSKAFTPGALRSLARKTGGAYSEASDPSQLAAIFDSLGARLSREYLVRYKSLAGPGKKIRVRIRVEGFSGSSVSGYTTPALPLKRTPPFTPSFAYRFWRSAGSMVLISLLVAGLLGLLVTLLLRPRPRTIRRRLAEFVSLHLTDVARRPASLTEGMFQGAERSLEKTRWWARFNEELEIAQIRMPAIQIVFLTAFATIAFAWIVATVSGVGIFAVVGLAIPFAVRSVIQQKLKRRRGAFAEQLPDNLQMLASALRAGHSLVGGLSVVVEDAEEPAKSEFRRVIADEQLGVPLEDALERVVRRMASEDLEQVALVAALHRETGGNTAEVLDRVTEVVRGRKELRERVRVLTAQGRLSRWVVTALPIALAGVLTLLNPSYMEPLFTHRFGQILLVLGAVMVTTGSLIIKRIVDIKV